MMPMAKHMALCLFLWGLTGLNPAFADEISCGVLSNPGQYGPFDYRTDRPALRIVEVWHFTPEVEFLQRGKSGSLGGDLDYVLRASPNHHRALIAMVKLGERLKVKKVPGATQSVECYFDRAIRWRADDVSVHLLYGFWLTKQGRKDEAMGELDRAAELSGDMPNVAYNLGLAYLDLKSYDKALEFAHKAYAVGYPLSGLRRRLEAIGKWVPPVVPKDEGVAVPKEEVLGAPKDGGVATANDAAPLAPVAEEPGGEGKKTK